MIHLYRNNIIRRQDGIGCLVKQAGSVKDCAETMESIVKDETSSLKAVSMKDDGCRWRSGSELTNICKA